MTKMARSTVRIAVTPILQQGNATVCEIDPMAGSSPHVKGGVIKLKKNTSYQLSFEIQQAVGGATVQFQGTGPTAFSCDSGGCPNNNSGSSGGFLSNPNIQDPGTCKILTVDADTGAGKGLMFYRLNFSDGTNYDPIVIHD